MNLRKHGGNDPKSSSTDLAKLDKPKHLQIVGICGIMNTGHIEICIKHTDTVAPTSPTIGQVLGKGTRAVSKGQTFSISGSPESQLIAEAFRRSQSESGHRPL